MNVKPKQNGIDLHLPFRLLCDESKVANDASISFTSFGENALVNDMDKLKKTTKYDPHLNVLLNTFPPISIFHGFFLLFFICEAFKLSLFYTFRTFRLKTVTLRLFTSFIYLHEYLLITFHTSILCFSCLSVLS